MYAHTYIASRVFERTQVRYCRERTTACEEKPAIAFPFQPSHVPSLFLRSTGISDMIFQSDSRPLNVWYASQATRSQGRHVRAPRARILRLTGAIYTNAYYTRGIPPKETNESFYLRILSKPSVKLTFPSNIKGLREKLFSVENTKFFENKARRIV